MQFTGIKRVNRELIYSEKYLQIIYIEKYLLKAEKENTKEGFQCLYAPVILLIQFIEKMKTITALFY